MAVAGLHNVSVLDTSFLRDSQAQASNRLSEDGTASIRASSLFQMWRGLEDEHVVNRTQERLRARLLEQRSNEFITDLSRTANAESQGSEHIVDLEYISVDENECSSLSEGQAELQNEHEVSTYSEHSSDFGEVERVRVRQIFQEWMNVGEFTSNESRANIGSRAEWLGETEQERVRIMRGWAQMNGQRRGTCANGRDEICAEFGSRIERIRDGLVANQMEGGTEHIRRGIFKLCGRQALLDMIKKAERERQVELQGLLEHRAVSNFAHRNRIQSLLRGRFLQNKRLVGNERSISGSSTAESELGLLRQRHTVSGLREEFLSRLDNTACVNTSSSTCEMSNNNINEQTQATNLHEILKDSSERSGINSLASHPQEEVSHVISGARDDLVGNGTQDTDSLESNAHLEQLEPVHGNAMTDCEWSIRHRFVDRDGAELNIDQGSGYATNGLGQETLQIDAGEGRNMVEVVHASDEHSEQSVDENVSHNLSDLADNLEGNVLDNVNLHESTSLVQRLDQFPEHHEQRWEQTVIESAEWAASYGDGNQEETTGWPLGNEVHLEGSHAEQHVEGNFQEAVHSWLDRPSDPAFSERQVQTHHFPDNENVSSVELRELLSRRRVSNLLHSGFRESLDQLLRSYVERQEHAAMESELYDTSPSPASVEQYMELTIGGPTEGQGNTVDSPFGALPLQPIPSSPPHWDQESHHDNWVQHAMPQQLGIEWEIINDMRIDMARLHQRMNNLQRILEACMDMQLELQRSIKQEVSAALNRSASSQGFCEDCSPGDVSKWDHVRKGICCVCCDSSIDSLLYRCGHMCTCSKCANKLVESRDKCPMCRAPVIEVIRAYSIL